MTHMARSKTKNTNGDEYELERMARLSRKVGLDGDLGD